jgi:hypothetical protein
MEFVILTKKCVGVGKLLAKSVCSGYYGTKVGVA